MKRENNNNDKWREPPPIEFLISGGSRKGPAPTPPPPPLFLDQTEARRSNFFWTGFHPTYLRVWMPGPPLTEGLDPPLHIPMIVIAKASLTISEKSGKIQIRSTKKS